MFPYRANLLRCHPLWGQLRSPITDGDITISSHRKLFWLCCDCDYVFYLGVHHLTVTSCRCSEHSKVFRTKRRPRYTGSIPAHLTQPIRTGLLQSIDNNSLLQLIASLIQGDNRDTVAHCYIQEVAQFSKTHLLDGGFWWEDGCQRKSGIRYKHKNKKRSRLHAEDAEVTASNHTNSNAVKGIAGEPISILDGKKTVMGHTATVENAGRQSTWDKVVLLTKNDPTVLWQIWDMHVAPILGFPGGITTFDEWKTTYDWERGYALLVDLADCLSVRYNEESLQFAENMPDERLLVAVIGHIRKCNVQTIVAYVAKLLGTAATHPQLVD
jgi:hypothetical protein